MDCPRCNSEMTPIEGEDISLQRSEECGGIWLDAADLNRLLVHNNLPVLERLGGKSNLDEVASGVCPECQVDLTVVEAADRHARYETCESCGGIWLELEDEPEGDGLVELESAIVDYFRAFRTER